MTVRSILSAIACAFVLGGVLILLGGAGPSASAFAEPSALTGASPAVLSDVVPAPTNLELTPANLVAAPSPEPAPVDPWRRGDLVGAAIAAVIALLGFGLRVDRKRAVYYTAGLVALGGCTDLIANGQTPNVGMVVGVASAFTLALMRSPLQPPVEWVRDRQRGSIGGLMLACLGCVAAVYLAGLAASCSSTQRRAAGGTVVDCSAVAIGTHADEIEKAARARDWTKVRAIVADLGVTVGGCAFSKAIAAVFGGARVDGDTAAEINLIRHELLGGRTYLLEGATTP